MAIPFDHNASMIADHMNMSMMAHGTVTSKASSSSSTATATATAQGGLIVRDSNDATGVFNSVLLSSQDDVKRINNYTNGNLEDKIDGNFDESPMRV